MATFATATTTTTIAAEPGLQSHSAVAGVVAGAFGGVGICLVGHPFETLKLRMQTGMFSTMKEALVETVRRDGIRHGLYAGVESPLLLGIVFRSWLLGCFECTKCLGMNVFATGAVTGLLATAVESPMLLLMNQVQGRPGTTVMQRAKAIWRARGAAGFTQGMTACAIRNVPSNAFYLSTFEFLKLECEWHPFLAGAVGGIAYCVFTYPLDTIRGCMHAQDPHPQFRLYGSWIDCASKILKGGGVRRLYRGYSVTLLRAVPANGAFFFMSDVARAWFCVHA